MSDSAQYQTQDSQYTRELGEQLKRIEHAVESGQKVAVRLVDGDRQAVITFKDRKVLETTAVHATPTGQKPPTLADNGRFVAAVEGSYAFDLQEAEREISPKDLGRRLHEAARERDDEEDLARIAAGLPITSITRFGGDREYKLTKDCTYPANAGYTITALKGFRTDLASVPKFLFLLMTGEDLAVTAPTFHDLIYRTGGVVVPDGAVAPEGKIVTKKEADDLFLELLTREKVSYFKRNVAYLAVSAFGRSSWKSRGE